MYSLAESIDQSDCLDNFLYDLVDKHFSKYITLVIFSTICSKNQQTLFERLVLFQAKVDEHLIFHKNTLSKVQTPNIVGHHKNSPLRRFMYLGKNIPVLY